MILKKLLGEILSDMGIITEQNLHEALKKQEALFQNISMSEKLPRAGIVSEARLAAGSAPCLGKILIDAGYTTQERIEFALKEQDKMIEKYKMLESEKLGLVIEECSIINSSINISEALRRIMKCAARVTNSEASTLMLLDDKTGALVFSVPTGPESEKLTDIQLPPGKGIAGWVVKNGKDVLIQDVCQDSRFYEKIDSATGFETKSIVCVPLKAKSRIIGALEVINKADGTSFKEEDSLFLSIFANHAAVAIENARFYTELKRKSEEEESMQIRLTESEKLRALGLMASGIAHDFNNMLAVILGNTELIEVADDKEAILKRTNAIKQAAIDSGNIIKRLQKFSKPEEDDNQFHSVKINDIVKDAVILTKPLWIDTLQEKGINISIAENLAEEDLVISGYGSDLREMVINLIFNSIDAMPNGGEINITTSKKDDNIIFAISDDGIGMSDETKEKIFDPFFTTKGATHSGLGMSMIYGIIKRHNGKMAVLSTLGKGTSFEFSFPKGAETSFDGNADAGAAPNIKQAGILIIDDNTQISDLLATILSKHGHRTSIFSNGKSGIEEFKRGDYDMLISDLGMPGMSGWEVINEARRIKPSAIFGLITGGVIDPDKAKLEGVDFIINKPFQVNDVELAVEKTLKARSIEDNSH